MANFKKVKNILHLVAWIFSAVAVGLLVNIGCIYCSNNWIESQFINGVVLGSLIITTILFSMVLFEEEVPEKSFYLLTIGEAILYIIAGVLLVFGRDDVASTDYSGSTRALCCGVLSLANGAIFLFEFIASLIKKEMLD